ncbi:MAG: YggS family pyridoxal phosphate-dependent enzyme, partial [Verrucomicrobia bacterium]|nr:YggS family pyridoxal phosphate-dependent enzyme [Verrucomicrobiota bacterium]
MDLAANLNSVQQRIAAACDRVGRDPASVTLLAVSKGQPPAVVRAAAELGLGLFGENKVQEAKAKISMCPGRLRWHMIGHLQSNKCRDAAHFFEMIQSVDSLSLAEELNKQCDKLAKRMP